MPSRLPAMIMQLSKQLRVIICGVLLCGPYLALGWWLWRTQRLASVAAFLAAVVITWILIASLARDWRRFLLWQFPLFLLSLAFAAYTVTYNYLPGHIIAAVLATSSLDDFLGFFTIWTGQRLALAFLFLSILYLWMAWEVPQLRIFSASRVALRWAILASTGALVLFAGLHADAMIDGLAADPLIGGVLFVTGPLRDVEAALSGHTVVKVPYGASRSGAEEIHVLVIGESARRDSWSAYGYVRETTPYLDSIKGELILFTNAVADANLTVFAVPMLLTGMAPEQYDLSSVHGNLVDLAMEAGYSTSWLMNQDVGVSTLVGIAAQHTVYPEALTRFFGGHTPLDETLLPSLAREMRRGGSARFIGLHVIGSHWEYYLRYPPAFQRFGTSTGLSVISMFMANDQRVVDAYDNSVLYTDWFLHQVIDQVRALQVPATVTYIADHGEDLSKLDGVAGHGVVYYTPHEFNIPAFIWTNDAYRKAHPDKTAAMRANAGKEIRTHNMFYSLADIMGIHWPGASPRDSFASTEFSPDTRSKVIAGGELVALQSAGH
jgi:glucan phosphoethanolaminetransferase (alkaline phosphatase superfamily)